MESEAKVFRPRRRRLLDLVFVVNGFVFLLFAFHAFSIEWFERLFLAFNILAFAAWFAVIKPLVTVKIEDHILTGHSSRFSKVSIPLKEVDQAKTKRTYHGYKRELFKDVWSQDGRRIRLQRKLLGERKVSEILRTIEKYSAETAG